MNRHGQIGIDHNDFTYQDEAHEMEDRTICACLGCERVLTEANRRILVQWPDYSYSAVCDLDCLDTWAHQSRKDDYAGPHMEVLCAFATEFLCQHSHDAKDRKWLGEMLQLGAAMMVDEAEVDIRRGE